MRTIYVASHTESEHHLNDLVGGWFDSELTEKDIADANVIAKTIRSEAEVDVIFSSDLKRAISTSNCIAEVMGAPIRMALALREMNIGDTEGKEQSWFDERIQPEDGGNRPDHRIVSGAETKREFAGRFFQYLDRLELPE